METVNTVTGAMTDPTPFIMMAYCVGALGLLGFAQWAAWQRLRLRAQLAVVQSSSPASGR